MTAPRRALVIIDVQKDYFDGPMTIQYPPREASLANIVRAIDSAEAEKLPVVVVQHMFPAGFPVFGEGSDGQELHPDIAARVDPEWKRVTKQYGSVFAGTDVAQYLADEGVDTISIVGFMTNNCNIATAAEAEAHGLAAEVLSDASGAIHLTNAAGSASAKQIHRTLMTLMHSNFAAVTSTDEWIEAVRSGVAVEKSNLVESAVGGLQSQAN